MKQGWEIKKLGELFNLKAGKSISSDNIKSDGGEDMYPCFGGNGIRGYVDTYIADGEYPIIGRVGALCGNIQLTQGKFYATEHAIVAYIKNNIIIAQWATLALKSLNLRQFAKGVAQPVISATQLAELCILVPPLNVQERIVAELDCLSGVIEKKREQLKQLDALAQSIFYQMFGDPITNEKRWQVKKLGEVCNKITDGTHDTPERLSSGVKFITGKHIRAGIIDYDNSDYVLKEIHDEIYARCNPEYGDVLYTNIGANLGTAAINVVRYEFSMKNVALLKVKKDIINGYYLQSYLNDEEVKDDIINSLSNGGAQKFLSLKMIAKISIPLPPLALQQEFAEKIDAIEKQKELIKKSIAETEELFNSRMDYYFN